MRFLQSKASYIESQGKGATVKGITLDILKKIEIPLPPLEEQKRIASILDKADNLRQKRQQVIELTDQLLRSVFLDMFGDPVTNPKGWDVKPLSSGIESIVSGWSAKGESYPCKSGELGVLKISSVTSGVFLQGENKLVHKHDIPEGKVLVFPKKGDLLFSRANTRDLVAATCIVPHDVNGVFLPDKLWSVKTDMNKMLPEFLDFLVKHPRFKMKLTSQATGTSGSMLNISKGKFEGMEAVFPPLELQESFQLIYWKIQESIDHYERSLCVSDKAVSSLSKMISL